MNWATLIPILVQYVAGPIITATIAHLQRQGVVVTPGQVPTPNALVASILADGVAYLQDHPAAGATAA